MEGDWGELSHGPTYPHTLWPNKPQSTAAILKSRDTVIMTRQAAIATLIEVRISTDLPSEGNFAHMIHGVRMKSSPGKNKFTFITWKHSFVICQISTVFRPKRRSNIVRLHWDQIWNPLIQAKLSDPKMKENWKLYFLAPIAFLKLQRIGAHPYTSQIELKFCIQCFSTIRRLLRHKHHALSRKGVFRSTLILSDRSPVK